ncbi:hypothetical protein BW247_05200 [Acidihalobacter ferrooxydans]|uniref:Hexulose-6-phosphate synthase n=2 Tax=Acidihalobacter ferrooxydans TaxID=1765967 RepID=A0A1P8UFE7_9GAMM|nr:hypothetical protein BW247_05200 [Acidihalobacter ferrooxydans]
MSKHKKMLEKLQAKQLPADVRWSELVGVFESLGYTLLKGKGSRRKFYHEETKALIICHEPHPASIVDKGCLADVVEHLKLNGII